jgi:hypothetical protein
MTPSELKAAILDHNPESHFFDHATMRLFGDSMANYGVRAATINTWTDDNPVEVWELYRKRPVKHGLMKSAFFRKSNLEQTYSKEG